MAVSFVQKVERTAPGFQSSFAPALPAGVAAGNLLILDVLGYQTGGATINTPSGWTAVLTAAVSFGDGNSRRYVWIKKAVVSEPDPSMVTSGGGNAYWQVVILEYSGQDPTTPQDGTASNGTADSDANVNTPGITTTVDGSMVVYFYSDQENSAPETLTPPAGATVRHFAFWATLGSHQGVSDMIQATAGTVAVGNQVRTSIGLSALAGTMAIRPAASASTFVPRIMAIT